MEGLYVRLCWVCEENSIVQEMNSGFTVYMVYNESDDRPVIFIESLNEIQ